MATIGRRRGARAGRLRRLSIVLMALGGLLMFASAARGSSHEVVVLPTTGIVDEGMSKYLADNIRLAEERNVAAVVIKLNTPGGALTSTNDIVGTILESRVPVIVWVAPAGGFAASAGTFITLAGHIALMAPSTSIGAATPVSGTGEEIPEDLRNKVVNDAVAKIRSIAEARGRNADWAESTVRDATSSAVSEAVALGAVDGEAATIEQVIDFADGREVETIAGPVTLDLAGAIVTEQAMNPLLAFIRILSDPNIAFLLFTLGSTGLLVELYAPNFVTGILGALALILGLMGLGTLPLNVGGFLLLLLGLVLFGLELTVTSHGLLGVGGLVCFALGASALFTGPIDPFEPVTRVAFPVVLVATATGAGFLALLVFGVISSRRVGRGVLFGSAIPIGTTGEVRAPLSPFGSVYAAGEEWRAQTADGKPLDRGTPVRVTKVEGLTLTVEPDASSSTGT